VSKYSSRTLPYLRLEGSRRLCGFAGIFILRNLRMRHCQELEA